MTLDECTPNARVSPRLKFSVLVHLDNGSALAYRPGELTKLEPMKTVVGGPLP